MEPRQVGGRELFRAAAARGQRPHTVDTSVPLPLRNKAQDSCGRAPPAAASSAAQGRRARGPGGQGATGPPGPGGVRTGAAPSQTGRAWGGAQEAAAPSHLCGPGQFWAAEWEGRTRQARCQGGAKAARSEAATVDSGQLRVLLLENRAQSGRARLCSRRSACLHPATRSVGTALGGAASHG